MEDINDRTIVTLPPRRGIGSGKGRAKGTPNKDKASLVLAIQHAVEKACGIKNFDAVVELAKIGAEATDPKIAISALAEVAQYTHPKRKAIEMTGSLNVTHEDWLENMEDE